MWNASNEKCKEVVENICPYCGEHLLMNKRSFANHVRWCKKNPKYEEIRKSTIEKINISNKNRYGELKKFNVECAKCGKQFVIEEKEKLFKPNKKYYCSLSCANSHIVSDETKEKIRNGIINYINNNGSFGFLPKDINSFLCREKRICKKCGKEFIPRKKKQNCCSAECQNKYRQIVNYTKKFNCSENEIEKYKILFSIYKKQCKFTFSVSKYNDEFNFSLIKENGWYSASNHGNNLSGVSRDHRFSINEGFKQKIDPYFLSHPANCELILQKDNSSKHDKCSLTKEELYEKVKEWNEKYGEYENKINYELLNEFKVLN
jgi:hypothetical protein